jgi:hypothetical protein
LKLFVYIIPVEHCPLLAESDRFGPRATARKRYSNPTSDEPLNLIQLWWYVFTPWSP